MGPPHPNVYSSEFLKIRPAEASPCPLLIAFLSALRKTPKETAFMKNWQKLRQGKGLHLPNHTAIVFYFFELINVNDSTTVGITI